MPPLSDSCAGFAGDERAVADPLPSFNGELALAGVLDSGRGDKSSTPVRAVYRLWYSFHKGEMGPLISKGQQTR